MRCGTMRTRSGLTYSGAKAIANDVRTAARITGKVLRAGRARLKKRKVTKPSDVRKIVRQQLQSTEERLISEIRPVLIDKRGFQAYLLGADITQGTAIASRSGNVIHMKKFVYKYTFTNTSNNTLANPLQKATLAGPVQLRMFLVEVKRTDVNPGFYWFKQFNTNGEFSFARPRGEGGDQTSATSDAQRAVNNLNTDEIRVLKRKYVTAHPASGADPIACTCIHGTFSFRFKTPIRLKYLNDTTATTPYVPQDLSRRIFFCYYLHQGDFFLNDTITTASLSSVTNLYFNDT